MKSKFRLFKRADDGREMDPAAEGFKPRNYYFKFTFRGQRYVRCLETNDAAEAQRRAKLKFSEITSAIATGEYHRLDATKLRHEHTGTIADLLGAYRTGPAEAGAPTRRTNINALKLLLGVGTARHHLETQSIREINPAAVRVYFEAVTTACLTQPDQGKAASAKRTANSTWAKARSLFTPKCLEYYRQKELYHESMEAFVRAGDLAKFSARSVGKVIYNSPQDEIIKKTLEAWAAVTDRNLYLAIGHELAFGLRIGEVAQACWSWHQIRAGYPVLDGRAAVKNGTGLIQVRALDPWYSQMKARIEKENWQGQPNEPIITGNDTYRKDGIFRAVSDWMRQLGWQTKKTNHALRAYAGGQIAMKYGIYEAQMWLRHSTVKVTEQNYSHFVSKFKPSDLETIAARWPNHIPAPAKVASAKPDAGLDAAADFRQPPLNLPKPEDTWHASRN